MEFMTSHGRWWVGITAEGQQVSVSTAFFLHLLDRQLQTNQECPWTIERAEKHYNVAPACFAPQWWIDAFREIRDGVGPTPHVWTRRKGYARVVLEADPDKYAAVPIPKPAGTIIFRHLHP